MAYSFNASNYPTNYNWLNEKQKRNILKWFQNMQELSQLGEKRESIIGIQNLSEINGKYDTGIKAAKQLLQQMDIYVEYNWPEHRNQFILATYTDALAHEAELDRIREQAYKDFEKGESNL